MLLRARPDVGFSMVCLTDARGDLGRPRALTCSDARRSARGDLNRPLALLQLQATAMPHARLPLETILELRIDLVRIFTFTKFRVLGYYQFPRISTHTLTRS